MRRQEAHHRKQAEIRAGTRAKNPRAFDYTLDYKSLDLRRQPHLYRVGVGEQGVLLVEPYKSEILPCWRFATPDKARESVEAIRALFDRYLGEGDFVGADLARKFLQMGFTRARRYVNHRGGRKYDPSGEELPRAPEDEVKAESARIFFEAWKEAEAEPRYARAKKAWKRERG
jgi:uncharacterized protein DUF4385